MLFYLLLGCSEHSYTHPIEIETPPDSEDSPIVLQDPIALCSVNPLEISPPFEPATFSGDGSYDPEGIPFSYHWELTAVPVGSTVSLFDGYLTTWDIIPDLAGLYEASLIITTDDGRVSEPCFASVTAIPAESLWVEMYWQYAGDDMDLHLINQNGNFEDLDNDCYYMNCKYGLDWFTAAITDDPFLDIDDIPGVGPENINIAHPANGTYTIVVHDYPLSVFDGNNDVTVNVYVNGNLAWTDTRGIYGEDYANYFATVAWPSGVVTPL